MASYSVAALAVSGFFVVQPPGVAHAAPCSDVDVSFARGTGEDPGLGIAGGPFTDQLTAELHDRSVSVYAVNYTAEFSQLSAGPGSRDLVDHLTSVAAQCPSTKFVIAGYSQGATAVTMALGVQTMSTGSSDTGAVIPTDIADRVDAVVVLGNPIGLRGNTIETASSTYGPRARSYCGVGDPVCERGGTDVIAHLRYGTNGLTTQGARFAAAQVRDQR